MASPVIGSFEVEDGMLAMDGIAINGNLGPEIDLL